MPSTNIAQLVDGFNRMTADLDASRIEIESRRRFTEAILESIPTGVISVNGAGQIQLVNPAFLKMFPRINADGGDTLDTLFSGEDAAEIRYLMNRARRIGLARCSILRFVARLELCNWPSRYRRSKAAAVPAS
jgi:PAS domain-containing protein